MPKMIWLGMDVHAASITVAQYEDQAPTATVQTIANDPAQVRRLVRRLPAGSDVRACYEAGSCGYGLHRQLTALGVHCDVIAPALIPRRPGERIKTDRRDAEKLGRFYRSGELTTITVPTPSQEGVRDLVRAREDVRRDRTAARQRLAKFLLRHGHRYPGSHWTKRHWEWVCGHTFDGPARTVFVHYPNFPSSRGRVSVFCILTSSSWHYILWMDVGTLRRSGRRRPSRSRSRAWALSGRTP